MQVAPAGSGGGTPAPPQRRTVPHVPQVPSPRTPPPSAPALPPLPPPAAFDGVPYDDAYASSDAEIQLHFRSKSAAARPRPLGNSTGGTPLPAFSFTSSSGERWGVLYS